MFDIIKKNYEKGLWTEQMVEIALKKGIITAEQYEKIISKNEKTK